MTPSARAEIRVACGAESGSVSVAVGGGPPTKPIGAVEKVEHERNDERAGDDADDQGGLLAPRCGADELAGLEILQVVIRDDGDGEDDAVISSAKATIEGSAGMPNSCIAPSIRSEATRMARMPTPETGLLEEPMRPAM